MPNQSPIRKKYWLFVLFALAIAGAVAITFWKHEPEATVGAQQAPAIRERTSPVAEPTNAVHGSRQSPSLQQPTIETTKNRKQNIDFQQKLDPTTDGWETEAAAVEISSRLKELGHAMVDPSVPMRSFATKAYQGTSLVPDKLEQRFQDAFVTAEQLVVPGSFQANGPEGFAESVRDLLTRIGYSKDSDQPVGSHFKVTGVTVGPDEISAQILVELSYANEEATNQVNATWDTRWSITDETLQFESIRVRKYQQTSVRVPGGKWFQDDAGSILPQDAMLREQLAHGHHHWLQRIERSLGFDTSVRNGLAIGDANGDGLDDLYLCQPPGLPNRLLIRQPDGTVRDDSAVAGVDFLDQTSSAIFCDLDNDGDQDLVLGTTSGILLLKNDSNGKFSIEETLKDIDYDVQSISVVDYDNDGLLDIFACVYRTLSPQASQEFTYRDAVGGGENRLFRSQISGSSWSFQNVTQATGLGDGANRFSLAASWADFDEDGDQDLYVANDFGRNYLYENREGKFVDVAKESGVLDVGSGMSASWGDYNGDGRMDLYVGNMFSSAGQRITSQVQFRETESDEIRNIYKRLAKGNSLFQNRGDGKFDETGDAAGVELGRWAWSSLFADINNDGREDLLVANGYMTTEDTGDL